MYGGSCADTQRSAQLLHGFRPTDGQHGDVVTDLHSALDGTVLVVTDREPREPAINCLRIVSEHDLT